LNITLKLADKVMIAIQNFVRVAFTMQCISEKFQLAQIAFLTENHEGINATLDERETKFRIEQGVVRQC